MAFQPGQSGNPNGRPQGRSRIASLRALLEPHAPDLIAKAVEMAKEGDTTALRLCLERLVPPVKPRDEPIADLPPMSGTLSEAGQAVLQSLADGKLGPDEAGAVLGAITQQARIVEVTEIERRLAALEEAVKR